MLKEHADDFIQLGEDIHDARAIYDLDENFDVDQITKERSFNIRGEEELRGELKQIMTLAKRLSLSTSLSLIERRLGYKESLPDSLKEFNMLIEIIKAELSGRTFLFIPPHRAQYYEWEGIVGDDVINSFPKSYQEIRAAGTCFATGLYTACVFHSMRASEIALKAFGIAYKIKIKSGKDIELAEWREILDGLNAAVQNLENLPNSTPNKDEDLQFCSEAAAQFRFFKNGWRIRVAHARATYNESQAKEVIDHVRSFFEFLVSRLKE
jgi:HEPN domain-containing protein